jgi:GH15 family glucan-1,4-alpha-glucosidase
VAYGLILADQSELSRAFFRFCQRVIQPEGYFLHKYTPTGDMASSWHPWVIEGQRVMPIQQDETALVLWALRKHFERFRDVEFIKPLYTPLILRPAQWMLCYRDHNGLPQQSWDLWEERRGVHLFTVCATIGALRAAAAFCSDFGDHDHAMAFREGAERMTAAMRRHMWNPAERRFARNVVPTKDGYRLDMTADAANYAIFAFTGLCVDDEMIREEMTNARERLAVKTGVGGYARYERDYYHQIERDNVEQVPGNPWVICSLWRAQYVIAGARTVDDLKEAMDLLEWCAWRCERSGVLAEQYHPYSGDAISVSPLTWSHATFIIVVLEYLAKLRELSPAAAQRASVSTV